MPHIYNNFFYYDYIKYADSCGYMKKQGDSHYVQLNPDTINNVLIFNQNLSYKRWME